jgi:hypothetical protein
LVGLCSGAYAAFQSAAQIRNAALIESVLINPLTFHWEDGRTIDDAPGLEILEHGHYLRSALSPSKWWRLLTNRSRIGLGGAIRVMLKRCGIGRGTKKTAAPVPKDAKKPVAYALGHPAVEDLAGDLSRITERNRHLKLIFSQGDPGYSLLQYYAASLVYRLRLLGKLQVEFIPNADHTFTREAARNDLIERLTAHLQRRYR